VAAPGAQLVATTTVPVISITQGEGPVLLLDNPNANDVLSRGPLVARGLAFDRGSADDAGIDRVQFFLNDRDAGGVSLGGTTVPGTANPALPRVYSTVVHIPANANGLQNFVAYARSELTGLETKVSVPVFIGAPPSPTPRFVGFGGAMVVVPWVFGRGPHQGDLLQMFARPGRLSRMTGTGAAVIVLAIADPDREIALDDTECLQCGTSGGCYEVSIY
jgi:hypothetical protein